MAKNELADLVVDLTDLSAASVRRAMREMNADDIINLKSAVDDDDAELVQELIQDLLPDNKPLKLSLKELRTDINRRGRNNLKDDQPMDTVWELVATLSLDDWKLIWPSIDQDVLAALYEEATDDTTTSVTAQQSDQIYDHSQEFVAESMVVYADQLVEVSVPRGPHGTVGVIIQGKTCMVHRSQVHKLDEHVMAMMHMPSLGRMQQLAGMGSAPPTQAYAPVINPKTVQARSDLAELQRAMDVIQLAMNTHDWDQALHACDLVQDQLCSVKTQVAELARPPASDQQ